MDKLPTLWINEAVKIPVLMLDNSGVPVTGIAYNQIVVNYTRETDTGMLTFVPSAGQWSERGLGLYALSLPGTIPNQTGVFAIVVTPPSSGSRQTFRAISNIDQRVEMRLLDLAASGHPDGSVGDCILNSVEYEVFGNPQYDYTNKILDFTCWLHKSGRIVTTPTSCEVKIYETNGGSVVADLLSSSPNSDGVFYVQSVGVNLDPNKNFAILCRITFNGTQYFSVDAAESLN